MQITEFSTGPYPIIFGQAPDWSLPHHYFFVIDGSDYTTDKIFPLIRGYQIGYASGDHHLERAQITATTVSTRSEGEGPDGHTVVGIDLKFYFNDDGGGIFPTDETLLAKVDILLVSDDGLE